MIHNPVAPDATQRSRPIACIRSIDSISRSVAQTAQTESSPQPTNSGRSDGGKLRLGRSIWPGRDALLMIRRTMTRLDRYILRQCFGVMIFVTAALSAAIWLAQSLRLIDLIVNRGLSIDVFLYLAALILPRFLDIVLPIGVFIAVLFTFNRLTAESELVVMRSAGSAISRWPSPY